MPVKARIDYATLEKLNSQLQSFTKDLAEDAASNARSIYSSKVYVGVENATDDRASVVARGFTMPFEEYGAGMMAIPDVVDGVVVGEDTWSVEHKQQYHRWGFWTHNGVTYSYIMPKYAMHDTVRMLQTQTNAKATRYFN